MVACRHIEFVLPLHARIPCGGVKVVFEYANRFAADGWKVTVAMSAAVGWKRMSLTAKLRALPYYIYCLLIRSNRYPKWFSLDSRVKCVTVFLPHYKLLPKADVYIVCSPGCAQYLSSYPSDNVKAYFIQHHDNWTMPDQEIYDTYRLNCKKLVIASWLEDLVRRNGGNDIHRIPNGFDFSVFRVKRTIQERTLPVVAVMYHTAAFKGYADAMAVLKIAKREIPEMKVVMFGAYDQPASLPDWVEYHHSPSGEQLADIYNHASVYLSASHSEGWGLTIGEAMACGAAVCCTACNGHLEMIAPGVSAITAAVGDIEGLAEGLMRLLRDNELRISVAEAGVRGIAKFTWQSSYEKLKGLC